MEIFKMMKAYRINCIKLLSLVTDKKTSASINLFPIASFKKMTDLLFIYTLLFIYITILYLT